MDIVAFYKVLFISSGAIFIIQSILGFIGLDGADEFDAGSDSIGFFTVRNLIAFTLGFSSAGYLLLRSAYSVTTAVVTGVMFGLFLVFTTFYGMRLLLKMQQVNKLENHEFRGIVATVTVKVEQNSYGKVEYVLNGRRDELSAVTDESEPLVKGEQVFVIKRLDDNSLLVRKKIVLQ